MSETLRKGSRRRVTYAQLEVLWEFLNSHRDVALGYNKSTQARDRLQTTWARVSKTLNAQVDGARKDWRGWAKYWVDYKAKLKTKATKLRTSHPQTGESPFEQSLSGIEQKFLLIIELKSEKDLPMAEVPGDGCATDSPDSDDDGVRDLIIASDVDEDPVPVKRRVRRRRRRPVLTAEEARRSLVQSSRMRAEAESRNSRTLEKMVNVLSDIHHVLQQINSKFNPT